jgi:hypothetical protein
LAKSNAQSLAEVESIRKFLASFSIFFKHFFSSQKAFSSSPRLLKNW